MKALITNALLLAYSVGLLNAQNENLGFASVQPHTHALIVGISDYKNISDLEFADDDALAFKQFLYNTLPSKADTNNIQSFLNEAAVSSSIYQALANLVDFAKEGDRVYIYFSGHGDSENATIFKSGFLLTHDTPPHNYYTNSINVDILNNFIHTLSIQNKADVIFIGDACHSGNLKQNTNSPAIAAAQVLAKNVAQEVRLLSCQPNEISIEGKQWGNGRGLFSYYLMKGLYGKADEMLVADGKVSLNELNIYLSTHVPKEADPVSQYPGVYGPLNKEIAYVNEMLLANLLEDEAQFLQPAMANSKGYEGLFLKSLNAEQKEAYLNFNTALKAKNLLAESEEDASDYLTVLENADVNENLKTLLKRNLIAALQIESQLYMNDLMDVKKRWKQKDIKYNEWSENLAYAADLMGEEHYLHHQTLAKHYFMKAASSYKKVLQQTNFGLQKRYAIETIKSINEAIKLDSLVPYYYTVKGLALNKMGHFEAALKVYNQAIGTNPNYPYSYSNKGMCLMALKRYEEAIQHFDKTIALDPTYTNAYLEKIKALKKMGKIQESIEVYEELLKVPNMVKGM